MLIVALILAVIGLAALVTAVVSSNEVVAWVCIGASGLGVLVLIVDAIRDRARKRSEIPAVDVLPEETTEVMEPVATDSADDETGYSAESFVNEEFDEAEKFEDAEEFAEAKEAEEAAESEELAEDVAAEDHPEELVHDEPDHDLPADDEADFPEPAEEAAVHAVSESYLEQDAEAEFIAGSAGDDIVAESTAELSSSTDPEADTLSVVDTYPGAETENVDTEDSPVGEERRDQ